MRRIGLNVNPVANLLWAEQAFGQSGAVIARDCRNEQ